MQMMFTLRVVNIESRLLNFNQKMQWFAQHKDYDVGL